MSRTRDEAMSLLDKFSAYAGSNPGGAQVVLAAMKRELIRIQLVQATAQTLKAGMKKQAAHKLGVANGQQKKGRGRPAGSKNKPKPDTAPATASSSQAVAAGEPV